MARRGSDFHFAGKLVVVLVLAAIGGFVWAMWETGRGPGDILKLFGGGETAAVEPAKKDAAKETPPPPPPATKKDTPKDLPKDAPKQPAKGYSAVEMESLFRDVDGKLAAGRIKEARDRIAGFNRLLVPPEHAARFRELETKTDLCHKLLQETSPGAAVPLPEMAEIVTLVGTRGILVKNLVEMGDEYAYETLTGIRSRLPKAQVRELTKLTETGRRMAAVDYELERLCQSRGVYATRAPNGMVFTAPVSVTGMAFFDLADFCARNGHNARLVPLFEESHRRDPGILATVHESKADRMVNVFFYFLSLHSKDDARTAYAILKTRYRDTKSYRDRIESDTDVVDGYQVLVGEKIAKALPPPRPEDPPVKPPPDPEPDPPVKPPPTVEGSDPKPVTTGATPLPDGAPDAAARCVRQGDGYYDEARKHLLNSDPNLNPDGWAAENKRALDLFTRAFEQYEAAQNAYDKAGQSVPSSLLKRFRETQMSRSLCRKRAVSSK